MRYRIDFINSHNKVLASVEMKARTPDEAELAATFRLAQLAEAGMEPAIKTQNEYVNCDVVLLQQAMQQ